MEGGMLDMDGWVAKRRIFFVACIISWSHGLLACGPWRLCRARRAYLGFPFEHVEG